MREIERRKELKRAWENIHPIDRPTWENLSVGNSFCHKRQEIETSQSLQWKTATGEPKNGLNIWLRWKGAKN